MLFKILNIVNIQIIAVVNYEYKSAHMFFPYKNPIINLREVLECT